MKMRQNQNNNRLILCEFSHYHAVFLIFPTNYAIVVLSTGSYDLIL